MHRFWCLVILLLCTQQLHGGTLYVPSQYGTIQQAIYAAIAGDTIVVSPGTYVENIDFKGKAITVRSTDPNDPNVVAATVINGSNPTDPNFGSVTLFKSGEDNNSVLAGFTITGGTGSWLLVSWQYKGLIWNRCGGGVLCCNMSEPTIIKNVFVNNRAGEGSGIYIYGDPVNPNTPSNPPVHVKPVITDNTFINNTALTGHGFAPPNTNYPNGDHGDGGAIVGFQGVDANITGNLIKNNHAENYGGGIHLRQWSNALIAENKIINNNSSLGAGIHITYTSSPTIRDNLIWANIAGDFGGGGIYILQYSSPLIERNVITQNESTNGAGIYVAGDGCNATIKNNLICNNINGAGIRVTGTAIATIINNTLVGNTASPSYGGGVCCLTSSVILIENNIIASNGSAYGIYVSRTSPVTRYNNVWGNGAGNYNPVIGDQTGINGNISSDPYFVAPDANDFHLAYSSPCINAGDPNFVPEPNETDYDNNPRILNQRIDIGAYEVQPVYNLINGKQYQTIQQAIDDANDYDVIVLTVGTYTGDGNRDIDFLGKAITVRSTDPNNPDIVHSTIIDCAGSAAEPHRGFIAYWAAGPFPPVCIIDGLTITNGYGTYGGAIYVYNDYTQLTVRNCFIVQNSADYGGGICCYGGFQELTVNNCSFAYNSAGQRGGGIYSEVATIYANYCTFVGNQSLGTSYYMDGGGGICSFGGSAYISHCVFNSNTTQVCGGGVNIYEITGLGSDEIVNCTFYKNSALIKGGAFSAFGCGSPASIIRNCIIWDNEPNDDPGIFAHADGKCLFDGIYADLSILQKNWQNGTGIIVADPCFADPNNDCHLKSQTGRWEPISRTWVKDDVTSIAIDAGDPNSDWTKELWPHGKRINLGAYGGTPEASMSLSAVGNIANLDNDPCDIVDFYDLAAFFEKWCYQEDLLAEDLDRNGRVDFNDFAIFGNEY
jgi:predicted outer membrane repeat protein